MADKIVEQPEVAAEEVEKELKEKKTEEVAPAGEEKPAGEAEEEEAEEDEDEDEAKENGAEKETNGKQATNGDSTPAADEEDKCCIKRKSTGGEAEEAKAEEAIPEKKTKLDEDAPAEAENGGEVAA